MKLRPVSTVIVFNREIPALAETAERSVWMHLAPATGAVDAASLDGRLVHQEFSPEALRTVVANFAPDVLVDFEHRSLLTDDTTAGAWIRELRLDEAGLHGLSAFTDLGWDAVANKRLRHQSPVFELDAAGRPVRLLCVALTNRHNIKSLRPILNKETAPDGEKGQTMEQIAAALGLPPDASPEDVLSKVTEVLGQVETLNAQVAELQGAAAAAETEALNKEAETFVAGLALKVKDPEAVKRQYVLNKEATIALFGAVEAPPPAKPALKRTDGQAPDGPTVALNKAADQHKALDEYRAAHPGVAFRAAWDACQRARPELFS